MNRARAHRPARLAPRPARAAFPVRAALVALGGLAALASAACIPVGPGGSHPPPADSAVATDGSITPTEVTFTPDRASPNAGELALVEASVSGSTLRLHVRIGQAFGVRGVAFRLDYDPAVLNFLSHESSPAFDGGSGPGVVLAAAPTGNKVVFGGTAVGEWLVDFPEATEIVVLTFQIVGAGTMRFDFEEGPDRSVVRGGYGFDLPTAFYGGLLEVTE